MHKLWIQVALLVSCSILTWGQEARGSSAKAPTAEAVLQKYLEASGGEESIGRVKTVIMRGSMEIPAQNVRASMVIYRADGGKSYSVVDIPGMGKQEDGSNGEIAWEKTALGPRVKDGVEKFLVTCSGDAMGEYTRALTGKDTCYAKVELAGEEMIDGKPAWKLLLTPKMGKVEEQFFDKASGLLVQQNMKMPSPLGELPITLVMNAYKTFEGVKTPTRVTMKMGTVEMQLNFAEVAFNVPIPDQMFAVPPDIQALVEAGKGK
jgi:hypothetical protein